MRVIAPDTGRVIIAEWIGDTVFVAPVLARVGASLDTAAHVLFLQIPPLLSTLPFFITHKLNLLITVQVAVT